MAKQKEDQSSNVLTRAVSFVPSSVNEEERTVEIIWTTGARVVRRTWQGDFVEELAVSKAAVDVRRLNAGAPLLNAHRNGSDALSIWGSVVPGSVRIEDGKGYARVKFDDADNDPDAEKIFRKIQKGIIRGVSVGYAIHAMRKTKEEVDGLPVFRVTKWEPFEVSVAPIQADLESKFRSFDMPPEAETTTTTNQPAPQENRQGVWQTRNQDIRTACRAVSLDDEFTNSILDDPEISTGEQARDKIFAELIRRSENSPGPRGSVIYTGGGDRLTESRNSIVKDVTEGRMGALELARTVLSAKGEKIPSSNQKLIQRAMMTTSDFPGVLDASVGASLRVGFENEPASHRKWVRVEPVPDFNEQKRPILGAAPGLNKVNEGGEYEHGALDEDTTSYRVSKYGRIVSLSWEVLVNDRLGAFLRTIPAMGQAARRKEADTVYGLFAENSGSGPTMQDAQVLFHADHKNLVTAGTFNAALLAAGRTLLRKQTTGDNAYLALEPHALIVPAELEHDAELLLAAATRIVSTTQEASTPKWLSGLTLVVEPRLAANAAYLTANPEQSDSFVLGVLEENMAGPYTETKDDFERDRRLMKIRHVFGAKATDHRGIVKMPVS